MYTMTSKQDKTFVTSYTYYKINYKPLKKDGFVRRFNKEFTATERTPETKIETRYEKVFRKVKFKYIGE